MNNLRISTYHDTRRKLDSGLYPVKLALIYKRKTNLYSTGIMLKKADYVKLTTSKRLPGELHQLKLQLDKDLQDAGDVTEIMTHFDFAEFKLKMKGGVVKGKDLISVLRIREQEFRGAKSIKSADLQVTVVNKLGKTEIPFEAVTPTFLKNLGKQWKDEGLSQSTISVYMRNIKAAINLAIYEGWIPATLYPFARGKGDKKKYIIRSSTSRRTVLTVQEIQEIEKLAGNRWVDYFLFSYYAQGINMADALLLTKANLDGKYIRFFREKTKHNPVQYQVSIRMTDRLQATIDKYTDGHFLLAGLQDVTDITRVKKDVANVNRLIHKNLKKLTGESIILTQAIQARHAYASHAYKAEIPLLTIKENLGHASVAMTEKYIKSFDDDDA